VKYFESKQTGIVVVSMAPGDLLLEGIIQVCKDAGIRDGILLQGLGSLTRGHIHTVVTNTVPPDNRFIKLPGPLEIVSFGGVIANYEPHVHICLMDNCINFFGGHLEDDCEILTLSEFSLQRLPDLKLVRRKADWTKGMRLVDADD
jgi:uncharacterized protein